MYRKLILLISLAAQILAAQDFNLSWIDQDAAGKATSLKKSFRIVKNNNSLSGSGMDIKFHRILLTLDPAVRFITGSVSTYFVPKSDNQQSIAFDMHNNLHVTAIRYHGELLTSYTHQNDKISIQLPSQPVTGNRQPAALIRDPSFTKLDSIMVDYQGIPVDDSTESFALSKHDNVPVLYTLSEPYGAKDWWPCSQDLNDKIDSVHLVITVPPRNRAAANGMLISEQHCDDRSIYQWKHKHPIAAYLIGVAVTNYAVYSDFVPLETGDSIEILNYVYPETLSDTRALTPNLVKPFQLYNRLFGLYPYADERYGHAQWNWGGGMEHQTMSFMGSFGYELMAHELGHQWFGDFLTCGSWKDIWLNEGFATYMSGLCYEHDLGGIYWEPFKRLSINRVIREPGGSVYCYDTTNIDRIFDSRLSYSKGAMVLHMLRWEMGDGNFFKAMNNYLYDPKLANGYATTEDFIRHAEAVADTSFREFFNDWIFGEGYPKYHIVYRLNPDNEVELEISQEPSDPSVSFFEMDLPVRLYGNGAAAELRSRSEGVPAFAGMTEKGSVQREGIPAFAGMTSASYVTVVLKHSYSGQVFRVNPGFKVDSVKFDPERWICTANPVVLNVAEIPYNQQLKIYPNPVTDQLTVELTMPEEGLHIRIFNQKGQLLHTGKTSYTSSRIQIPMHSFARGVYTVEVEGRKAFSVVKE
ncbi:MAG: M1 family aminopeptidase [Bacteroidia bacterium]|nr:M1 family aminopeptidase [Bacteroidia bacterium]